MIPYKLLIPTKQLTSLHGGLITLSVSEKWCENPILRRSTCNFFKKMIISRKNSKPLPHQYSLPKKNFSNNLLAQFHKFYTILNILDPIQIYRDLIFFVIWKNASFLNSNLDKPSHWHYTNRYLSICNNRFPPVNDIAQY